MNAVVVGDIVKLNIVDHCHRKSWRFTYLMQAGHKSSDRPISL